MSLSGNIACYADCRDSVVGQCVGYKDKCNRFYCKQHSTDNLCGICASQAQEDRARAELIDEYSQLSEKVHNNALLRAKRLVNSKNYIIVPSILVIILFNFYVAYLIAGENISIVIFLWSLVSLPTMFIPTAIMSWMYGGKLKLEFDTEIKNIVATKPGFDVFYARWKQYKSDQAKAELKQYFKDTAGEILFIAAATHKTVQVGKDIINQDNRR